MSDTYCCNSEAYSRSDFQLSQSNRSETFMTSVDSTRRQRRYSSDDPILYSKSSHFMRYFSSFADYRQRLSPASNSVKRAVSQAALAASLNLPGSSTLYRSPR